MRLYRTITSPVLEREDGFFMVYESWDALLSRDNLCAHLRNVNPNDLEPLVAASPGSLELRAPIAGQELWAAGVTYRKSREAREEEAEQSGGGTFYERVYDAERPELFFKATPNRVKGHREPVRIRSDSSWTVPEPELTLAISSGGKIVGYTVGNDMSARDIEGENPLYLPQAKIYDGSCALGPGILLAEEELSAQTEIVLEVMRKGKVAFQGSTQLSQMKRSPTELVEYLYRELTFPRGCLLMTGTGIVPPSDFTLQVEDDIRITIEPIGTLINVVAD
jgi:2-dehydro-3-deoxy-D-arabinonate dehydratase